MGMRSDKDFSLSYVFLPDIKYPVIGLTYIIAGTLGISRVFSGAFAVLTSYVSLWRCGRISVHAVVAVTPVSGFLLWYAYDRFVPDYGFMNSSVTLYQHGLSWFRFGVAFALESAIALVYWLTLRRLRMS